MVALALRRRRGMNQYCGDLGGIHEHAIYVAGDCQPYGCAEYARNEDDSVVGPDDPVDHRTFSRYSAPSYAAGELNDLEARGLNEEQQLCYFDILLSNLPPAIVTKLDAYARNALVLAE